MDRRHSRTRTRGAALWAGGLAAIGSAAPASAATETFQYTGAAQTWTVPLGVTSVTFDLFGAAGSGADTPTFPQPDFAGGPGGRATATIAVTPGASIQL